MNLMTRIALLLIPALVAAEWNSGAGFGYLEARHLEWTGWKYSQRPGGACFSCHTGLPYLMALRAQGRSDSSFAEGIRVRLASHPAGSEFPRHEGAEAVLNMVVLSLLRPGREHPLTQTDRIALDRLWKSQIAEGDAKGAWKWFVNGLDPLDTEVSHYYGAALAELALASYPDQPRENVEALRAFLRRDAPKQPLHNRLAWIAFSPDAPRQAVLRELWAAQERDGGWTAKSLGPWAPHPDAPPDNGSNAYATAWSAFAAHRAGAGCSDTRLKKALHWLERKQDRVTGAWKSVSMNQVYEAGSTQEKFMTDAATGFAAAVLVECGRGGPR